MTAVSVTDGGGGSETGTRRRPPPYLWRPQQPDTRSKQAICSSDGAQIKEAQITPRAKISNIYGL